jgi:hypothetical protein
MKTFDELSEADQEAFLKFPVYVCLLAANADGKTDEKELDVSISFEHMKTYTSNPLLLMFYDKADRVFKQNLTKINNELPEGKLERDAVIKIQLKKIKDILVQFDPAYAKAMHDSMKSFKEHVSEAHHNVLEDFLFPIPIKGLTE